MCMLKFKVSDRFSGSTDKQSFPLKAFNFLQPEKQKRLMDIDKKLKRKIFVHNSGTGGGGLSCGTSCNNSHY